MIDLEKERGSEHLDAELLMEFLSPPKECPNPGSPRMVFQWNCLLHAEGPVLNVGSADDPLGFRGRATHFDIDDWSDFYASLSIEEGVHIPFVQGDAHHLTDYFGEGSFDTVIMGDIVEHLLHPLRALIEAVTVARRALCYTVWEEWRCPTPGQWIAEAQEVYESLAREKGYKDAQEMYDAEHAGCVPYDNKELPHWGHINQFTDDDVALLTEGVAHAGLMQVRFFAKVPEVVHEGHQAYNWLVYMTR